MPTGCLNNYVKGNFIKTKYNFNADFLNLDLFQI